MVFPADDKNLPDVLEFIGRCLDSISCPKKARIQIGISVEEVLSISPTMPMINREAV